LVNSNLAAEWKSPPGMSDWHPAGTEGVNVGGKVYGVPHWLCGHFIFTRDKKVAKAKTVSTLLEALDSANPAVTNVAGVLTGSWNMPALYLDAWADTYGPKNVGSAVSTNLDAAVMKSFKQFSRQCETGGKNPCLNGTFGGNPDQSAKEFAAGRADAFFGYSERLNFILRQGAGGAPVRVASAPLGEGKRPLLFVDAFVMRGDCDAGCREAAAKFAAYMNRPQTHEWILTSQDAGASAVPRYLLPATHSAFKAPLVRRDAYFKTLRKEIKDGAPYPASGIPEMRKKMRDEILKQLQQ
jgi:thiamine pyridinylase